MTTTDFKPPSMTDWFFDDNISKKPLINNQSGRQITSSYNKIPNFDNNRNINNKIRSPNHYFYKNNTNNTNINTKYTIPLKTGINHQYFNHLPPNIKRVITDILVSQFGNDIDLYETTMAHLVYLNKTIVAIICSDLDENIANLYRQKGCKEVGSLGVKSNSVYLYNLWINPDYRGNSIAKKLIIEIEDYFIAREKQSIRTQVNQNNIISNRIFKSLGFLPETQYIDTNGCCQTNYSKWIK